MSNIKPTNITTEKHDELRRRAEAKLQEQIASLGIEDLAKDAGVVVKSPVEIELDRIITQNEKMIHAKEVVKKFYNKNIPVLITGPTGTGKELYARALHTGRSGNFVGVNCGGIPDTLLESEFFGSVQGAFTGATNRRGYFEEANNGTLFLDEIGELPRLMQTKLLRVLQENIVRRVGSNQDIKINCRIVSATNNIEITNTKLFRADLYFRVAGTVIELVPLMERVKDIQLIITHYLGEEHGKKLWDMIQQVELSGNVRQLLNLIQEYKVFNDLV